MPASDVKLATEDMCHTEKSEWPPNPYRFIKRGPHNRCDGSRPLYPPL